MPINLPFIFGLVVLDEFDIFSPYDSMHSLPTRMSALGYARESRTMDADKTLENLRLLMNIRPPFSFNFI